MSIVKLDLSYKIKAKAKEINPLLENIFSKLKSILAAEKFKELEFKLELAAREMLANAIEHGSALTGVKNRNKDKNIVKINLKLTDEILIFKVEDSGSGFNWENYDLETMPKLSERGRGLKMVNQVSDQLEFNEAGNIIKAYFEIK